MADICRCGCGQPGLLRNFPTKEEAKEFSRRRIETVNEWAARVVSEDAARKKAALDMDRRIFEKLGAPPTRVEVMKRSSVGKTESIPPEDWTPIYPDTLTPEGSAALLRALVAKGFTVEITDDPYRRRTTVTVHDWNHALDYALVKDWEPGATSGPVEATLQGAALAAVEYLEVRA